MVERKRNGQELKEEFAVLGSVGNVRTGLLFTEILTDRIARFTLSRLIIYHLVAVCYVPIA